MTTEPAFEPFDEEWARDTEAPREPGPEVLSEVRARYGYRCPACAAILGDVPEVGADGRYVRRPALCLEVGSPVDRRHTWRLSVVGNHTATRKSYQPAFHPNSIEHTYILCGNGHIFPYSAALGENEKHFGVHYWNTVAAMGPVASGKTYLLTRMLDQSLTHVGDFPGGRRDDRVTVRTYAGAPLEDYTLNQRRAQYDATLTTGQPMGATVAQSLAPYQILNSLVSPVMYDAVIELLRETVTETMVDETSWGTMPPQPIMLRTRVGDGAAGRHGWTCVVDLAGEFFEDRDERSAVGTVRERAVLRGYNALVWAIDPLLEAQVFDRFARSALEAQEPGSYDRLLRGSLRPGATSDDPDAENFTRTVRAQRRRVQRTIAQRITKLEGEFLTDDHSRVRLLVAVSKVDIIRLALEKTMDRAPARLDDIGKRGAFKAGIVHYLDHVARNVGEVYHPDPDCAELLRRLDVRLVADEYVLRERLSDLADSLLDHYSDAERFWHLVEEGSATDVRLGADPDDPYYDGPVLHVPSVGEHLRRALQPGPADQAGRAGADDPLLTRDLVMSAMGCGLVFALGYGEAMVGLMSMPWADVRVFLCSPLAATPQESPGRDRPTMDPFDDTVDFADTVDRSASLTQLLLRVLRGVL
ncbi:hypothetical protein [Cryptosporangium aurantiacum]|uniref:Uncharacterized protein n=1 Tax=Cryptosporangium aurantiacum TaxID=134849 RepID=A0A1M7RI51_9ACTN|nr:hypothetical protein [Cryptosporangium aurantiacum]SHN45831.1 hypothetical protein SAMN05443668_11324 [Cryptosporangium aurantiacum]